MIDFAIRSLGRGHLEAVGLKHLVGQFYLDFDFLEPAELKVEYKDGKLAVAAKLGVREGVLSGVSSAEIFVRLGPEGTTVEGAATLSVPGLQGTQLIAKYDQEPTDGEPQPTLTASGHGLARVQIGKLTLTGDLGIGGAASVDANIGWTPQAGLSLDLPVRLVAEPKFVFKVDASIHVTADIWLTEITLYTHTWNLANYTFGSGLRFGIELPVHWDEIGGFDFSFDNIRITQPHIDIQKLAHQLMSELIG